MKEIIIALISLGFLVLGMNGIQKTIGKITKVVRTISISDTAKFNNLVVKTVTDATATYDSIYKTATFFVNEIGPDKSWRLVHDGCSVIDLFYTSGITSTIYKIFEAKTSAECLGEIKRLGLEDKREFKEENLIKTEAIK